jgi:hypothetical protein
MKYVIATAITVAVLTGCATQVPKTAPPNPYYTLGQNEARTALQTPEYPAVNGNPSFWCEVLWNGLAETSGIPAPNNSAIWTRGCISVAH